MAFPSRLGLFGCALSSLLFATAARAQCSKDTDCKGDRICEDGACVSPAPLPPPPAAPSGATTPPAATTDKAAAPPPVATDAAATPAPGPRWVEPTPAPTQGPTWHRHSTGMMVGGIVMVSLSPIALLVSMVGGLAKAVCNSDTYYDTRPSDCGRFNVAIYGGLLSGAALLGVGVPFIVTGAKREPNASARLSPWATPQGAGLGFSVDL